MVKSQFKEREMGETKRRAKYTLEYKLEAVRFVKGGKAVSVTAKILGIPKASLDNWVRLSARGELKGAGDKPVSPEQMELARLRAELARVKMERDILKKRRRTSQRNLCEVRLDCQQQSLLAHHAGLRRPRSERQWVL
jgi:transposase